MINEDIADFLLRRRAAPCWPRRTRCCRAGRTLAALTRLRKTATPEQAAAAWEMAELRRRGQAKFGPLAAQMYFVREALEQASGRGTADYHARRLRGGRRPWRTSAAASAATRWPLPAPGWA